MFREGGGVGMCDPIQRTAGASRMFGVNHFTISHPQYIPSMLYHNPKSGNADLTPARTPHIGFGVQERELLMWILASRLPES